MVLNLQPHPTPILMVPFELEQIGLKEKYYMMIKRIKAIVNLKMSLY